MWDVCEASWAGLHQSNSIFLNNILSIVDHRLEDVAKREAARVQALTYYVAVNTVGIPIFWRVKRKNERAERESGRKAGWGVDDR